MFSDTPARALAFYVPAMMLLQVSESLCEKTCIRDGLLGSDLKDVLQYDFAASAWIDKIAMVLP